MWSGAVPYEPLGWRLLSLTLLRDLSLKSSLDGNVALGKLVNIHTKLLRYREYNNNLVRRYLP